MMENQFFLAVKDLWRKKWHSLILLVQVTLMLVLIQFSVLSFVDLRHMKEEISRLTKDHEIYGLMDVTNDEDISNLINDDDKMPDMHALYTYIFHNPSFASFSLFSSWLPFEDDRLLKFKGVTYEDGESLVDYALVTEEFFHYFQVDIAKGRGFDPEDYINKVEAMPVIIGSDFADVWDVGDRFTDVYENNYEVVGVLEKGATFIDVMSSREIYNLDAMMVLPVNESEFQMMPDYDEVIPNTYIIPQDDTTPQEIIDYAAELETYTFLYKNVSEQAKHVISDKQTWIQMQLFLIILVTIFTLISLIVSLLQFIDKNRYEFGVHYLSGAENKHIMMRLVFQILPFFIIGNVASIFLATTLLSTSITLLASLLLGILVVAIPLVKIQRTGLSSILRWKNR
ncbi:ABC transporter permease [Salipaludibacillus sp. LMS25]|jgi:putative ABC transport system permease protein|uniref:ABC transporter permease n=1 Tax=Salipaludibacillus sp. LMS25 TaxID=2924031 RepID=UPI0020D1A1B2|nr:ABC transporter permease [Salipaludibacillus sp. LMS25]UTR16781.1 ABC transporter permease [Salipaludibacillus sp. LMS25]